MNDEKNYGHTLTKTKILRPEEKKKSFFNHFKESEPNKKVFDPYQPPKFITDRTTSKEQITIRTLLSSKQELAASKFQRSI